MRPAVAIASAVRWLGAGQGYQAVGREIAWTAVRSTGADQSELEWLVPLVEGRLVERIERLPSVVRGVVSRAETAHLARRPHDGEGAEMLAELAACDAAVEQLSIAYMDILDWAVGVLRTRAAETGGVVKGWRRLFKKQIADAPVHCELRERILEGLVRQSDRPGWPDRRAA